MHKRPLVVVEWEDTTSRGSWVDEKDADFKCCLVYSVGWKMKATPKHIVLSAMRADNGDCSERTKIPRKGIKSIRRVE